MSPKKPVTTNPVQPAGLPITGAKTAPTVTPSSPAAVSPVVKTPAGQAYTKSLVGSTTPQATTLPNVPTTMTNPPSTPAPAATPEPAKNPAMDNYIAAYKKYIDTQSSNEDVKNAKTAYNDFMAEQVKDNKN